MVVKRYGAIYSMVKVTPELLANHPSMDIYVCGKDFDRVTAERDALQQLLNARDDEVGRLLIKIKGLQLDKERIDALESNGWDIRNSSSPIADTGDYSNAIEIVGRWMDKPHERVIGENYNENLRAALDQAMDADAYPPARPEYPEIDLALENQA